MNPMHEVILGWVHSHPDAGEVVITTYPAPFHSTYYAAVVPMATLDDIRGRVDSLIKENASLRQVLLDLTKTSDEKP